MASVKRAQSDKVTDSFHTLESRSPLTVLMGMFCHGRGILNIADYKWSWELFSSRNSITIEWKGDSRVIWSLRFIFLLLFFNTSNRIPNLFDHKSEQLFIYPILFSFDYKSVACYHSLSEQQQFSIYKEGLHYQLLINYTRVIFKIRIVGNQNSLMLKLKLW